MPEVMIRMIRRASVETLDELLGEIYQDMTPNEKKSCIVDMWPDAVFTSARVTMSRKAKQIDGHHFTPDERIKFINLVGKPAWEAVFAFIDQLTGVKGEEQ